MRLDGATAQTALVERAGPRSNVQHRVAVAHTGKLHEERRKRSTSTCP